MEDDHRFPTADQVLWSFARRQSEAPALRQSVADLCRDPSAGVVGGRSEQEQGSGLPAANSVGGGHGVVHDGRRRRSSAADAQVEVRGIRVQVPPELFRGG